MCFYCKLCLQTPFENLWDCVKTELTENKLCFSSALLRSLAPFLHSFPPPSLCFINLVFNLELAEIHVGHTINSIKAAKLGLLLMWKSH